ncbi:MAG: hypothetical protein ACRDXD_01125 [Acidimicrobiia bacterium]
MRKTVVLALIALLVVGVAAPAWGHVHGITPLVDLDCTGVDNTVTGANQTNNTPAASSEGGPITGLIPRDVGNAPLAPGDGGRTAVGTTVCP